MTVTLDFATLLRRCARDHARRPVVWSEGREQTYADMFARACRLANALADLGIVPGDRVAVLGPNGPETVEQVAGIAHGGFVRTALYAHQTGEVNAHLLDAVGARALIVQGAQLPALRDHLAGCPTLAHVIVYGAADSDGPQHDYEALLAAASADDRGVAQAPDEAHVIRFSAGTTGRPKGIVHTVGNWLRGGDEFRWVTPRLDERDAYLACAPLTHAAIVFLWPMLQVGARIVIMDAFAPDRALELIEEQRATFTLMVPTMIQAIVDHPDATRRDASSMRCLSYAGAPISQRTMDRAREVFGEDVLHQWYAQSEAWPVTMLLPHQHAEHGRSAGRPTPNTVLTVRDDAGDEVAPGEIGEICVRTPGQMRGQWNDPEGTAARTLPDGSIRTRDMGRLDAEGFLHLADRKDDMIISGGHNIWPAALESAIASHPAVAEVCVVGIPHERWGETPAAVIVPRPGQTPEPEEIIALTRERVGGVQKVTAVHLVDELPKSGVGKVARREVRERFWAGREGRLGGA